MADELDFNNLLRLSADGDRDTSLQVSVFRGTASIAIFQGTGAPKLKLSLGQKLSWEVIPTMLEKLRDNLAPGTKTELPATTFNSETKKRDPYATLVFGRDDKGTPYLGVAGRGIKPSKFLIRTGLDLDVSSLMTAAETSTLALNAMIYVFRNQVPMAVALTSFKREFTRGGGGQQRSGGGSGQGGSAGGQSGGGDDYIPF